MKKIIFCLIIFFASVCAAQPPAYPPGPWISTGGAMAPTGNIAINPYYISGDGDDEGIYIDTDGNVGIGTTSPESLLDVVDGSVRVENGTIVLYEQDGEEFAVVFNATNAYGYFSLYTDGGKTVSFNGLTGGKSYVISGNFGVGTDDPDTKLEVSGIIKTTPMASATCDADSEGGVYYDSDDSHFYGCDGSSWVQLDN